MTNSQLRDTVLFIDDDPDLRALVKEIGTLAGVKVIEAENCCDGLKILDQEFGSIKLVLMDYFMPGMTPVNCANSLQEKVKAAQIPVILVTAAVAPQERAAELNLSRWLAKPFELNYMMRILKTCEV